MAYGLIELKDIGGLAKKILVFIFPGSAPSALGSRVGVPVHQLYGGEEHIGEVGGRIAAISLTPTITGGAYDAGDCVGGKLTFAGMSRIALGSGEIIGAVIVDKSRVGAALDLMLFDADPNDGSTTLTNNSAPVIAAADAGKLIGSFRFVEYEDPGGVRFAQARGSIPFSLAAGSSLWGALVLRAETGPPTYASASDLIIRLFVRQN